MGFLQVIQASQFSLSAVMATAMGGIRGIAIEADIAGIPIMGATIVTIMAVMDT